MFWLLQSDSISEIITKQQNVKQLKGIVYGWLKQLWSEENWPEITIIQSAMGTSKKYFDVKKSMGIANISKKTFFLNVIPVFQVAYALLLFHEFLF